LKILSCGLKMLPETTLLHQLSWQVKTRQHYKEKTYLGRIAIKKPSLLIIGAGAVGLVVGYHMAVGGTAVTFYVRPSRRKSFDSFQTLYCYDDSELKTFRDFDVISDTSEMASRQFDFILLTLDGASCYSEEGKKLLGDIGENILNASTQMIMCGVGIGLREHILNATGLPDHRLLEGTLGNASHQVSANLPIHPPTSETKLSEATMAYRHFPNRVGFMLAPGNREKALAFAALYNACNISKCSLINLSIYRIYTNIFFCYTVTCELTGWPDARGLAGKREMLSLCIGAMKEIVGLSQFGWIGKCVRPMLCKTLFIRTISKMEKDLLPLDFSAFNKFHHGGKVLAQDIQVLENCLHEGERQKKPMNNLRDLLLQFDNHQKNRQEITG
jgi:Ketopantoate reductase PanE/ApbA